MPVASLFLVVLFASPAQGSERCARLADSVAAMVIGAPERALGYARTLRRECRNNFDALYRAGRAINRSTRYEQVRADMLLRQEAEQILNRSAQLRPRNASAYFEYGVALKKRGGLQVDAMRAINRALELAERFPDSTPPRLLAEIQFQRARHLQDWVDRLRWRKDPAGIPVMSPECSDLGAFCENYTHPAAFNERIAEARDAGLDFAEQRDTLVRLYAGILRLDPQYLEAAERYGRELALGEEWEELAAFARRQDAGPAPGYFAAVRALSEDRLGRRARADSLFRAAIPTLPEETRRWFERPPHPLDAIADYWVRARPLWLAPHNELQTEYWSRLTYALLVFRDREAEVAGPETPMGDALIRYGWPRRQVQLAFEANRVLSPNQMAALIANTLDCSVTASPNPTANVGLPTCGATDQPGPTPNATLTRWHLWTYEPDHPSFIFEQPASGRVPRYVWESRAQVHATLLRERSPLTFTSRIAPNPIPLSVQIARFKQVGGGGGTTVAFFGMAETRDSAATGLFVFRNVETFPRVAERRGATGRGEARLDYDVALPPGSYAYSLEVFDAAFGGAGTARDSFTVAPWWPDSLQISDLLIADSIAPVVAATSGSWQDVHAVPNRALAVRPPGPVWLVWEVYGAGSAPGGNARYDVGVTLQDQSARALPIRLLQRLGLASGQRAPAATLRWTSERRPAPDGRTLEYVSIQLPDDASGRYLLTVTVTDPATGRRTTTSRNIAVVGN